MHNHIYITVGVKNKHGIYVDKNGIPCSVMNYRGEAGPGDDPESFQRKMRDRKGGQAEVFISDKLLPPGTLIVADGRQFIINYPKCWDDKLRDMFAKQEKGQ